MTLTKTDDKYGDLEIIKDRYVQNKISARPEPHGICVWRSKVERCLVCDQLVLGTEAGNGWHINYRRNREYKLAQNIILLSLTKMLLLLRDITMENCSQ